MNVVRQQESNWALTFFILMTLLFFISPLLCATRSKSQKKQVFFAIAPAVRLKKEMVTIARALNASSDAAIYPSERRRRVALLFKKSISLLAQPGENKWFDRVSYLQVPLGIMATNAKRLEEADLGDFSAETAQLMSTVCSQMPLEFGFNVCLMNNSEREYAENPHPTQLLAILFSGLSEERILYRHKSLQCLLLKYKELEEAFFELARALIQRGANPECGFKLDSQRTFRCAIASVQGCIMAENQTLEVQRFWISVSEKLMKWRYGYQHPYGSLSNGSSSLSLKEALVICRADSDTSKLSLFERKVQRKVGSMLGSERMLKWRGPSFSRKQ